MFGMFNISLGLAPEPRYLEMQMKADPWLNDPAYSVTEEDKDKMTLDRQVGDGTRKLQPLAMK